MKENQIVSIIIPAYNAEKYIKDTISSVLNQTYPYFEIIVVDDASSDNTAEVVMSIKDERVRLLRHKENMGPGGARNTGIEAAQGTWFAELDADDQWLPTRLEKLLAVSENGYFVADNHLMCFDCPSGLKPWISRFEQLKIETNSVMDIDLARFIEIGAPAIYPIVPLKFIRDNDIKYKPYCFFGEDFEFYCQLLISGLQLRLCGEPLYLRRMTPGSLTTKSNNDLVKVYQELLADSRLISKEKEALKVNLDKMQQQQRFNDFLRLLRNKQWHEALSQLASKPILAYDCLKRLPRLISYYTTAKRVGGKMRF